MNSIYQVNNDFDFSKLTLANPNGLQGGAYFTKLKMNNEPLYMQMPRSLTKQGIVKTEKKIYCDLLFSNEDTNVIEWLSNLEERVQEIIYEKRNLWFQQELELDDIQTAFNSSLRTYKGTKHLVRTNIITPKHISYKPNIQIFDEDERSKSIEEVTSTNPIISIIEIAGVKFTSRNFQLDIYLKQIMMLDNKPLFNGCLIKKNTSEQSDNDNNNNENTKISIFKKNSENNLVNNDNSDNDSNTSLESDKSDDDIHNEEQQNLKEKKTITTEKQSKKDLVNSDDLIINKESEVEQELEQNKKQEVEEAIKEEIVEDTKLEVVEDTKQEVVEDTKQEVQQNIKQELQQDSKQNLLEEIDIGGYEDLGNNESISLKQPTDVYIEIYKEAKEKAKRARLSAIQAYLEAKKIKKTYLIDNYIDSDSDEDKFFQNSDESLIQENNNDIQNEVAI